MKDVAILFSVFNGDQDITDQKLEEVIKFASYISHRKEIKNIEKHPDNYFLFQESHNK